MLSFDDFKKLDLRVGKVVAAERIEGSEKLLRLDVDFGDFSRQVIAGVGLQYSPDDMAERSIIVIVNLEPRTILGHESHGMLLAADGENGPILLMPDRETFPGARIK